MLRRYLILSLISVALSCDNDSITGLPTVSTIVVTASPSTILTGDSTRAIATALGETGSTISAYPVTWSSSDTAIASVSTSGVVRGRVPGEARISASGGGQTGSTTIKIMAVPARSIVITPNAPSVTAGDPLQLSAEVRDSAGNPLIGRVPAWSSETPLIASVSNTGLVQTLQPGQARIRATVEAATAVATISAVPGALKSLQILPTFQILYAGGSEASTAVGEFFVSASDARGFPVPASVLQTSWTSEDAAKVQVTSSGLPFGLAETPGVRVFGSSGGVTGETTVRVVRVVRIEAGDRFGCFLISTGATYCWGREEQGELGRGLAAGNTLFPNPVSSHPPFVSIDAGANTTCGLTADGTAYCWGANWRGQIGDSSGVGGRLVPTRVKTATRFSQISVGRYHTCGISADGSIYCWGQALAALGGSNAPERVNTDIQLKQISVGAYFQCGLDQAGAAWCWGQNEWGQLGNGSTTIRSEFVAQPTRVLGDLTFKQIVSGRELTCAITTAGQLYCWGREIASSANDHAITAPRLIEGDIAFESIALYESTICGVSAGRAYCRGGVPGDGSSFMSSAFVQVRPPGNATSANYVGVAVGSSFSCVLTKEGLPSCWGSDSGSGRNPPTNLTTFAPVPLSRPLVVSQPF